MSVAPAQIYLLAIPLVIVISIVYSASRHEAWTRIWSHALRLSLWIFALLIAATGLLLLINTQV
jgi:threonine/homoserine/homoserine lactone efflux protein